MEAIRIATNVAEDGSIHIDVQTSLPPGPAEVVVVVHPAQNDPEVDWADWYGVDKQTWAGIDAQAYVDSLRDEWD